MNEISNQPTARLSEKLYCNWIIMLVSMATPIFSDVKDKSSGEVKHDLYGKRLTDVTCLSFAVLSSCTFVLKLPVHTEKSGNE